MENNFVSLVISVLLGGLVGLRRELELQKNQSSGFRGVRTTALVSLLGTISTFFPQFNYLPIIVFLFIGLYVAIVYYHGVQENKIGLTSEVSLILIYWSGVLIGYQEYLLGAILSIMVALSDGYKTKMHYFAKTLTPKEWLGAIQMLLISAILIPFLPKEAIDPWGVIHPRDIWFLVVIITGLSFVGYFVNKYFHSKKIKGIYLTSFLGAMISSTAVTVQISDKIKKKEIDQITFLSALFLAIGVMQVRDLIIITLSSPVRNWDILGTSVIMIIFSFLAFWFYYSKDRKTKKENSEKIKIEKGSPFDILPALKFGGIFVIVLLGVYWLKEWFGNHGVYLGAFLISLVDTETLILPSLESFKNGIINLDMLRNIIVIALVVNTIVKLFYILFVGGKEVAKKTWISLTIVSLSGLLIFLF